jgi:CubicO group peptidase (beta-lactamase class C family)
MSAGIQPFVFAQKFDEYANEKPDIVFGEGVLPMPFTAKIGVAVVACALALPSVAQNPSYVEQHIQQVTSGLIDGIVPKGEEHSTHTLADRMKELNVPGVSIAVIHNGRIEWARGFGERSIGGQPVNPETMFQAGSISKPLAAMACLRLVQEGKLALDTDVNTYVTSWKVPSDPAAQGKPITLRELLRHTAGTTVHGFPGYASTEAVPTLVQVLNGQKPANTPPIRSEAVPGTRWNYSGGGYEIMQQALLDVTKEPFPKLLHDTVFAPIGMARSTYEQPLPQNLRDNVATPYRRDGKPIEGGAHTYPELAAAGLWTTPTDIARYAIEVERSVDGNANHVLSPEMTQQMLTAGMGHWGLGLEIGGSDSNLYFSHGGDNAGFHNNFVMYEKSGDGLVVMTNGDNGNLLGDELMHSVANEYNWADFRPTVRASIHIDPKVLETYKGSHESKDFNMVINVENGQLMGRAFGQPFPLYAESETRFFFTVIPGDFDFVKDEQGNVTSLVLHQNGQDWKAQKK